MLLSPTLQYLILQLLLRVRGQDVRRVGPEAIPRDQQTWNFDLEHRCRLLAHSSIVLKDDERQQHILVIDGGMAKFRFTWQDEELEVLDLNPYTLTIDLTQPFSAESPNIVSQLKKDPEQGVPILNRFGMWTDSSRRNIYLQGGHFYDAPKWNESQYWVPEEDIPPYTIWKLDLESREWTQIFDDPSLNRTVSGAALSIPEQNRSFYLGGYASPRSGKDNPQNVSLPQSQILEYDHGADELTDETYYGENNNDGYWNGILRYLPIGCGKGFLVSLMAEKNPAGIYFEDLPVVNDEKGQEVPFRHIMIYDLEKRQWYNQSTTYMNDEVPIPRTRFCGELVHGTETDTWELWIYGGQRVDEHEDGVDDMWVLTMPSFIWTRIDVPFADNDTRIRSHTCHALGSQLVVVGGYPPGDAVVETAECEPSLLRIFNMNDPGWKSTYETTTVYKTPAIIVERAELTSPNRRQPFQNRWASTALERAFAGCSIDPPPVDDGGLSGGAIAGIVIGVLAAVAIAAGAAYLYWFIWRKRKDNAPPTNKSTTVLEQFQMMNRVDGDNK